MIKKIIIVLILLFVTAVLSINYLTEQHMTKPMNLASETMLDVEKGTSFYRFSKTLVEKGWVDNRLWLRIYAKKHPQLTRLKAGSYMVTPNTSAKQLLEQLVEGKEFHWSITFIEGSTFKDMLNVLAQHEEVKQTLSDMSVAQIAQKLAIDNPNPEGWFYPETYAFTKGTTDLALLKRAHVKMKTVLEQAWNNKAKDLPYKSPYEALIMASIVEKESAYTKEMPRISSVFVNRLNKGMRLQTDPTVIYGLGDRYQGDIKRKHLREKTAYNTYRINGLPPTPIAMPGLTAIEATLHPEQSDYLYFVAQGGGQHYFSKTLAEHNKAVRKYILGK
ncbi:endolytic transglycosylase MltG [Thalassotalea agarivorans]|uniref:Endolytic murein transglycosylase n=1 Tax=Thalassotalea agarivorans TaxID=349064 RepID=A0A1I0EUD1_THASX|nr:endolytic transglycosylase MltG [Thalassotalea agarivorans]SET49024.1 UPF0755 protein [Thalassotalea agarivorans]